MTLLWRMMRWLEAPLGNPVVGEPMPWLKPTASWALKMRINLLDYLLISFLDALGALGRGSNSVVFRPRHPSGVRQKQGLPS